MLHAIFVGIAVVGSFGLLMIVVVLWMNVNFSYSSLREQAKKQPRETVAEVITGILLVLMVAIGCAGVLTTHAEWNAGEVIAAVGSFIAAAALLVAFIILPQMALGVWDDSKKAKE
jgi:peptidoglycan biosynthesis protein MviN/MurJ (putative lipid II flippase)